jgi:hypothetical protein
MRGARFALRGRAAGWWFLLAAVAVVVAANALLANRSTEPGLPEAGSGPAPQPESRQGVSVAQREFGLLSGGGWAQAWRLWSAAARSTMSQSDFVRLNTECRPALGVPYIIDSTATVGPTTVSVTWHQGTTTGTSSVRYENGEWRFVPDATTLAGYREGLAPLLDARKAAGQCH